SSASSAPRARVSRSSLRNTASSTVSTAPIPTHTAYAVPVGMTFIAYARPTMLTIIETRNNTDGQSFLKPFDALSAVAQTASSIPEAINTIHSMADPPTGVVPENQDYRPSRLVRHAGSAYAKSLPYRGESRNTGLDPGLNLVARQGRVDHEEALGVGRREGEEGLANAHVELGLL